MTSPTNGSRAAGGPRGEATLHIHTEQIVAVVKGAYGTKVFLRNHRRLEELPKTEESGSIADEVKKFQESRKGMDERIAAFKAQQEEKKKSLFADIEKKLKKK